jgi:hypothetical protein
MEEPKFIPLVQKMLAVIEAQAQEKYHETEEVSYFILGAFTEQQLNDVRTFITSFEGVYENEVVAE